VINIVHLVNWIGKYYLRIQIVWGEGDVRHTCVDSYLRLKEVSVEKYRLPSLSDPHRWSLHGSSCIVADSATSATIPVCCESGSACFISVYCNAYWSFSQLHLKKLLEGFSSHQASSLRRMSVGSVSPSCTAWRYQFTKFTLATRSVSWDSFITVVLCGYQCSSFVAVPAVDVVSPVCCASRTGGFRGGVSNLARISSNFSSARVFYVFSRMKPVARYIFTRLKIVLNMRIGYLLSEFASTPRVVSYIWRIYRTETRDVRMVSHCDWWLDWSTMQT
jgi:hypothetical protein